MKCAKLFRCFVVTIWVQEATIQINEIKSTKGYKCKGYHIRLGKLLNCKSLQLGEWLGERRCLILVLSSLP